MVLAGGCASGVTYRIGEGNAVAIIAATFYALFAGAARNGKLKPITALFGKPITVTMENPGVYAAKDGQVAQQLLTYWVSIHGLLRLFLL